jgi:hypothetical protein
MRATRIPWDNRIDGISYRASFAAAYSDLKEVLGNADDRPWDKTAAGWVFYFEEIGEAVTIYTSCYVDFGYSEGVAENSVKSVQVWNIGARNNEVSTPMLEFILGSVKGAEAME